MFKYQCVFVLVKSNSLFEVQTTEPLVIKILCLW